MFGCRVSVAVLVLALSLATRTASAQTAAKLLGEQELVALLGVGLDDQTLVSRINKGIQFDVTDDVLEKLMQAGASAAVIEAVQAAGQKRSAPAPAAPSGRAVTYDQVLLLLSTGIDEPAILQRLAKSPTVFILSAEQIAELKQAGASETLIKALQSPRAVPPAASELITDFAIVLDCSGSMKEATPEGEAKMVAAKRVVTELVSNIPDGLHVTFVIYGHEVFGGANDPRNCEAVKVARPLSPLDPAGKRALAAQIDRLRPTGATPIALSLKTAGAELAKNDAFCGLILITDGLETCHGDPVAEAAALAENPKLSFGVNVIGFGTKPDEDKVLAGIAESGKGKYYDADSAKDLAEAMASVTRELETVAKKPDVVTSNRRAIKVLKPEIEFPDYAEIRVITRGLGSIAVVARGKYGDEIRLPSATDKYEILWVPKTGEPVAMLKDFTLAERRVIEIKPEEHLGMIKVNGRGTPKDGILVYQRGLGSILRLQECKKYGEIIVVPADTVNVSVDGEDIEQGLEVEAGKLHELE